MILYQQIKVIWTSDKVDGIERYWAMFLRSLMFFSLIYWITMSLRRPWRYIVTEIYILVRLALLLILIRSITTQLWHVIVGFELYISLLNVVFMTKYPFGGPVKSIERSLILFFLNVAEINLWFGILYRFMLPQLGPAQGFTTAMLVFGTLGHPLKEGAESSCLNLMVSFQIALDFVFVAIVAGSLIGKLRAFHGPE